MHVSWTEWKNLFSLEIYCRTAKLQVDGLVRSYGPQRLTRYLMKPETGAAGRRHDRVSPRGRLVDADGGIPRRDRR